MAKKPWYKSLFERDYHDYFYRAGPASRTDEEEEQRSKAQAAFIAEQLALPDGARVLDLCCGWGRISLPLAKLGYRVTGLDLSPYHIRLAKQASKREKLDIEWIADDMRNVTGRGRFDAIANCFTSFGYLESEAEDQKVLDGVGRALKPGGRFLLETMNRDNLMRIFRESEFRELPNGDFMMERRKYDAHAGRINVDWFYEPKDGKRIKQSHSVRLYTFQELAAMMEQAGLNVVDTWGGLDGSKYTMYSPRMVVMAERA